MSDVVVVIGAGSIGQAIARRVSAGKHVLLADLRARRTRTLRRRCSPTRGSRRAPPPWTCHCASRCSRSSSRPPRWVRSPGGSTPPASPPPGATGADPARRPLRHRPGPRGVRHGHRRWRFGNRHRLAVGPPTARPDTRAGPGAGHVPLLAAIAADVRPATLERELAIMAETDLSEHILSRPPATCGVDARRPVPTDLGRRRMHLECTMLHSWIRARRTWQWPSAHACDRCGSRGDGRSTSWQRVPGSVAGWWSTWSRVRRTRASGRC